METELNDITAASERERLPRRSKQEVGLGDERRPCPICNKLIHVTFLERHCNRCCEQKFGDLNIGSRQRRDSRYKSSRRSSTTKAAARRKSHASTFEKDLLNDTMRTTTAANLRALSKNDDEEDDFADDETNFISSRSATYRKKLKAAARRSTTSKRTSSQSKVKKKDNFIPENIDMPDAPQIRSMALPPNSKLMSRVMQADRDLEQIPLNAVVVANSRGNIDKKRSGQIQRAIEAKHPELPTIKTRRRRPPSTDRPPLVMKVKVIEAGFRCYVPTLHAGEDDVDDEDGENSNKGDDDDEYVENYERRRSRRRRRRLTPMQTAVAAADSSIARTRPRRKDSVADVQAITLAIKETKRASIPATKVITSNDQDHEKKEESIDKKDETSRPSTKRPLVPVVFSSSSESEMEDAENSRQVPRARDQSGESVRPLPKEGESKAKQQRKAKTSDTLPTIRDAHNYVERMRSIHKIPSVTIATFVALLKAYKNTQLSTHSITRRVSSLLKDHPDLVNDFRKFLPAALSDNKTSSRRPTIVKSQGPVSAPNMKPMNVTVAKRSSVKSTTPKSPPAVDLSEIGNGTRYQVVSKRSRDSGKSRMSKSAKRRTTSTSPTPVPAAHVLANLRNSPATSESFGFLDNSSGKKRDRENGTSSSAKKKKKISPTPSPPYQHSNGVMSSSTSRPRPPELIFPLQPSFPKAASCEDDQNRLEITKIDGFDGIAPPGGVAGVKWYSCEDLDDLTKESPSSSRQTNWLDVVGPDHPHAHSEQSDIISQDEHKALTITAIDGYDDVPPPSPLQNAEVATSKPVSKTMNGSTNRDFSQMSTLSHRVQERFKDDPVVVGSFYRIVIAAHYKISPSNGLAPLPTVISTLAAMFDEIESLFNGRADDLLEALIDAQPNHTRIRQQRALLADEKRRSTVNNGQHTHTAAS